MPSSVPSATSSSSGGGVKNRERTPSAWLELSRSRRRVHDQRLPEHVAAPKRVVEALGRVDAHHRVLSARATVALHAQQLVVDELDQLALVARVHQHRLAEHERPHRGQLQQRRLADAGRAVQRKERRGTQLENDLVRYLRRRASETEPNKKKSKFRSSRSK